LAALPPRDAADTAPLPGPHRFHVGPAAGRLHHPSPDRQGRDPRTATRSDALAAMRPLSRAFAMAAASRSGSSTDAG